MRYKIIKFMIKGPLQQQKLIKNLLLAHNGQTDLNPVRQMHLEDRINAILQAVQEMQQHQVRAKIGLILQLLHSPTILTAQQNTPSIIKFLKLLIQLIGRFENNIKTEQIRQIVNVFISKIGQINIQNELPQSEKIQQLQNWKICIKQEQTLQLCISIALYLIEWVDLQNLQQAFILYYFLVQIKAKISDSTTSSIIWLIRKSIIKIKEEGKFVSQVSLFVLKNLINKILQFKAFSHLAIKIYANFLILLLRSSPEDENIKYFQSQFANFSVIELLFALRQQNNFDVDKVQLCKSLSQEKQQLFLALCEIFLKSESKIFKEFIKFIMDTETTTMMVNNCWVLLNYDRNQLITNIEIIHRTKRLLNYLKQKNSVNRKVCMLANKGSWISKPIEKRPSICVLKMQLLHPRGQKTQKTINVLRLQFQRGTVSILMNFNQPSDFNTKGGYKFYIRKCIRQNFQNEPMFQINFPCKSIFVTIVIQLRNDNKICVCAQDRVLYEFNQADLGKPKQILVGVRQFQSNQYLNGVQKIFTMILINQMTFNQYLQQRIKFNESFSQQKTPGLRRTQSFQQNKKVVKWSIFQEIEIKNNKLNFLTEPTKFEGLTTKNIKSFIQMANQFSGKQRLIPYLIVCAKKIKNVNCLKTYVELIKQLYCLFPYCQTDFYQINFVLGFCIHLKKQLQIVKVVAELADFSEGDSKNSKSTKKNERFMCVLQLLLSIRPSINYKNVEQQSEISKFIQEYLRQSISKQNKQYRLQLSEKDECRLNYVIWDFINDLISQNHEKGINLTSVDVQKQISIAKFMLLIDQIKRQILVNCEWSDAQVFSSLENALNLLLILLVNCYLMPQYKASQIVITLSQYQQLLQLYIQKLNIAKSIGPEFEAKICQILSKIYNVLPVLSLFCKIQQKQCCSSSQIERKFYEVYSSSSKRIYHLKINKAYNLMNRLFKTCFEIGSYCLKDNKNGFLAYTIFAISFLKQHDQVFCWSQGVDRMSTRTRIFLNQIYLNCWRFLFRSSKQKYCTFDKSTKIEVIGHLNELSYPIYCLYSSNDKKGELLLKQILQFYILQNSDEQVPLGILANVEKTQLQLILNEIKQKKIDNTQDRMQILRSYSRIVKIINSNPDKSISINFENSSATQAHITQFTSSLLYRWYLFYNEIKRIRNKIKQNQLNEQISNSYSIEESMKINQLQLQQVRKLFSHPNLSKQKQFASIQKIINNFVINQQKDTQILDASNMDKQFQIFIQVLYHQCMSINASKNFDGPTRKKSKKIPQKQSLNFQREENKRYFRIQQPKSEAEEITVYKRILSESQAYFLDMYEKIAKVKTNTLIGYYKMIERLSMEQKIWRPGNSKKYNQYNFYVLDDYLNKQGVKTMLKKDYASVFNNKICGDIPKLEQSEQQNENKQHIEFAIKITKNLVFLNSNVFFEIINQMELSEKQSTKPKNVIGIVFLITKSKIYQGKIQIDSQYIRFVEHTSIDIKSYQKLYASKSEMRTFQQISLSRKVIKIEIASILYSQPKRYLQKLPSLQIYAGNLSYFLAFLKKQDRDALIYRSHIQAINSAKSVQIVNQICFKWQMGWISNFQLIANLNSISGRSLNDVSQYYVFPWTLIKFRGLINQEFFKDKNNFRDLLKSIGSINPKKFSIIRSKYESSKKQQSFNEKPYMFGAFYSNSGYVCNFLLRVSPFTNHHYELQGGTFDLLDRLFYNMEVQYQSVYNSTMDNRELIPEFYSAPQFFRNRNRYNFAHDPSKMKVELKMQMPEWVTTNSPEQFVFRMRKALQSDIVSKDLSDWIDLIFGYKSDQQNAAEHNNLYLHKLYRNKQTGKQKQLKQQQKNQMLNEIEIKAHMIKQFGQVPKNIFGSKTSLPKKVKEITQNITQGHRRTIKLFQASASHTFPFVFDFQQEILVIACKNNMIVLNIMEQVQRMQYQLPEQVKTISIVKIKKSKFCMVSCITVSGRLIIYLVKRLLKRALLISQKEQYRLQQKFQQLYPSISFNLIKNLNQHIFITEDNSIKILKIDKNKAYKAKENVQLFEESTTKQKTYLNDNGYLFIHRSNIALLQTYQNLGIVVSLDESGLVNTFSYAENQLIMRGTFKINCLKSSQLITKIIVHSLGVIVFSTNCKQILVYNIYGDPIYRIFMENQSISDIAFFDSNSSSDILIATKVGTIFQTDLFGLLKSGQDCLKGISLNLQNDKKNQIKINQRKNNKILVERFGKQWVVVIIQSSNKIELIKCQKQLQQVYGRKKFLKSCNQNNQYRNFQ